MAYGDDPSQGGGNAQFASGISGNYRMNPQTGQYSPYGSQAVQGTGNNQGDPNSILQNTVQSLMKGYLRRSPNGYLGLQSAAPTNALDPFKPLDRYRSFGVPYTGITNESDAVGKSANPYSAMFNQAPTGSGY